MKRLLITAAILAFAATAFADGNPDVRIYLDVDPPNKIHEIHPQPSESFDVYVCLDCFGDDPFLSGTRGTAFLFERSFNGFKLAQTSLLGGLDFGDVEADGWTLAAGADCIYPVDDIACVGFVTYLFLGPDPGFIMLLPHPGTGREVLDCDFLSDYYCIYANLGVSMPPPEGEPDCDCEPPNPVEDSTWGGIKSLYR